MKKIIIVRITAWERKHTIPSTCAHHIYVDIEENGILLHERIFEELKEALVWTADIIEKEFPKHTVVMSGEIPIPIQG